MTEQDGEGKPLTVLPLAVLACTKVHFFETAVTVVLFKVWKPLE